MRCSEQATLSSPYSYSLFIMTVDVPSAAVPSIMTKLGQQLKLILAFVVGILLSLAAWISCQGWFVCSNHFFGKWSAENTLKIILFRVLGYLFHSRAWWIFFRRCFDSSDDIDDVGRLSSIFGYILAEYIGSAFSPPTILASVCLLLSLFGHVWSNSLNLPNEGEWSCMSWQETGIKVDYCSLAYLWTFFRVSSSLSVLLPSVYKCMYCSPPLVCIDTFSCRPCNSKLIRMPPQNGRWD